MHGLGATNNDFLPLASQIKSFPQLTDKNVLCVFPQAPSTNGANSWWDISSLISSFATAVMTKNVDVLAKPLRAEPGGLIKNRTKLISLLDDIIDEHNLSKEGLLQLPLTIGGFSQGAMTALDVSLNLPARLIYKNTINILIMSGAPIMIDNCYSQIELLTKGNKKINVLATHGNADVVIPVVANQWICSLFQPFKEKVNFQNQLHNGGHELGGPVVMQSILSFISQNLN